VTGPVVPKYTVDTYPAQQAIYGQGGWRTVDAHATRNSLTVTYPLRCEQSMIVVTLDDGIAWQLGPEPWTGTDTDWSIFTISVVLSPRQSCRVATTVNLNATYANGTLGVGATLTNAGSLAALSIDGVSLTTSDRVLVKNQSTAAQNGIYAVTTVGSGSVAWVLTRATDYDQASEVAEGTYTIVAAGTVQFGTLWIESNVGPFTIGTTAINWIELQTASLPVTLTGAVTGSGTGTVATTIPDGSIVYAKIQDVAAFTLLGNPTGSPAAASEITLGANLGFSGNSLVASGGGGGGGTVTSVAMTVPSVLLAVAGSPITAAGTLAVTLATQAANKVFAGPTTGSATTPTFRSLVAADLPAGTIVSYPVARFAVGPGSDIAVANDVANWVPLVGSGILHGAYINSKTGDGPVGSSLIIDIKLSTNGGSTFTSLWATTPANRPTIADGAVVGSAGTPDTTAYVNGNLVRVDVLQVGSTTPGRNVIVSLY
jgi:hypothetical protein